MKFFFFEMTSVLGSHHGIVDMWSFFSLLLLLSATILIESSEVLIETLTKPDQCEKQAKNGDTVFMRYKGNLLDTTTGEVGKEFDSNFGRGGSFEH